MDRLIASVLLVFALQCPLLTLGVFGGLTFATTVELASVVAQRAPDNGHGCVRAIAYRDRVPLDESAGTRLYTFPMLALGYSNATYVYDDERALRDALVSARDAHCQVDLYLLVLGGFPYSSIMDGFAPRAPPALRLVYDTGGSDLRDGHHWVE
ncbi:MAG TPA: hypothetical protein VGO62_04205, partial [Myxococcota bacterium]